MGGILSDAEFQDILRRVREALGEIPKQFQRLIDNINSVLDWLPGFLLEKINQALRAVGDFIGKILTVAWLAIVSAIVSFVVELTAEAGAAATGAGAPPAAAAAGVSAAKVWGIVAAALAVLEAFVTGSLLPSIKDLNQRITNNEGFPGGHWPALTTDISDSSHKDNKGQNAPWEMSKA